MYVMTEPQIHYVHLQKLKTMGANRENIQRGNEKERNNTFHEYRKVTWGVESEWIKYSESERKRPQKHWESVAIVSPIEVSHGLLGLNRVE